MLVNYDDYLINPRNVLHQKRNIFKETHKEWDTTEISLSWYIKIETESCKVPK